MVDIGIAIATFLIVNSDDAVTPTTIDRVISTVNVSVGEVLATTIFISEWVIGTVKRGWSGCLFNHGLCKKVSQRICHCYTDLSAKIAFLTQGFGFSKN